jgi:hypothetical protein
MTNQTYKEKITQTVLDQLEGNNWTFDEALKKWWMTSRSSTGLRLTPIGDLEFNYAKIEYHDFVLSNSIKKSYYSFILELNKKIKCPYFIGVNKSNNETKPFIRLYDSRVTMMLSLYGDIDSYLKSIKTHR